MHSLSTGESPVITVRVPPELVEEMDRYRADYGLSRSAFLRHALRWTIHGTPMQEEGAE